MANVSTGAHDTRQSRKAAASGWIGSALEYYDFFIYATAASLVFPQIFFPAGNPTVAIIASLATYGVGYVARPIGGFVLGQYGDTHGRKKVLLACMFLMGISTMLVGVLPTYAQAGPLAPALLVALRLVQGFAVAGEISGASSMILEHAPLGRRGFYASFTLQGVQAGQIMAAAVFLPLAHYMPADAFLSWGWRVPFLLSVVVIVAGYFIRRNVEETPVFAEQNKTGVSRAPALEAIKYCWPDMVRVMCVALMNTVATVATIFGAAYAVQPAYGIGFDSDVYLWIPVLGNTVAVVLIPFVGNLSDRIGRRIPIMVGALGSGLLSYRLSVRDQPPQRAAGHRRLDHDVGRGVSGLQRDLPELLPRDVSGADPCLGCRDRAEHRHDADSADAGRVCHRRAPGIERADDRRLADVRHHDHRGRRGVHRTRDVSLARRRPRQQKCFTDSRGRIRGHSRRGARLPALIADAASTIWQFFEVRHSNLAKCRQFHAFPGSYRTGTVTSLGAATPDATVMPQRRRSWC